MLSVESRRVAYEIVRDLKHPLLGYFVLHIIGKTARFVGEFAPGLTTTRSKEFGDRPAAVFGRQRAV
jgi:hypothetical protein